MFNKKKNNLMAWKDMEMAMATRLLYVIVDIFIFISYKFQKKCPRKHVGQSKFKVTLC